ncbi:alpha/beta hydrolase [Planotetraspora phitsanulokensis]|uniref:Alpha/beta hydrolase n=1 Tax=Planotetraspora phitsanulokensis TaxID=575192 RepID=A0A8J3U337_9ACTN|nr:alpha/beta hydrolase [Planotetraspora phitsanulokensis]GII36376.1 alpha/beta hydrolase [Planotetraspora phitsanulokensis]
MSGYKTGSVTSADGTVIGYRQLGSGPAVILLHGGMLAAQHLMRLADVLSSRYTVYLPDRRGRGVSGPHGADYRIAREVEDVQALAAASDASRIFGLSSGALVALRTALEIPSIARVAVYEPPLDVDGSVPVSWVPRFDREIAAGKPASALVTALKGLDVEPVFGRIPRFVLVPLMTTAMRLQRGGPAHEVPVAELIPTMHLDLRLIEEMTGTAKDYAALDTPVLLLGGANSPAYFARILDELHRVLPHAERVTFPKLGHSGTENDGDPQVVGETLLRFFG